MKTRSKTSAYIVRSSAAVLLLSCVVVALCSAINLPGHPPKGPTPDNNTAFGVNAHESVPSMASSTLGTSRTLSFAERVAYQRAIEDVYWRHRIWPKDRPDAKPSLDAVMSQAQLEKKVADYLRKSQALEDYWQRPITAEQLQAEMDRMAQHTKQPEVLRELFEALGNDPFVIAECLARPALAERLLTNWYGYDQRIHGDLKQRAAAELLGHQSVDEMKQTRGNYSEIELVKSDGAQENPNPSAPHAVTLNSAEWSETVQKLAATFGVRRSGSGRTALQSADMSAQSNNTAAEAFGSIPTGKLGTLQEDETRYYSTAVLNRTNDRLRLATVSWTKAPLESWVAGAENEVRNVVAAMTHGYSFPKPLDGVGCIDDSWAATSMNAPRGRFNPTAVWTGSEMIVWGGYEFISTVLFNTGGRYNPSTDTWIATSNNNAPEPRIHHTAVWTGTEMIIWGGNVENHSLNTGGRYNPTTDSWTPTNMINAPYYRSHHSAVWTGTQMIIWGGSDGYTDFNTGGRYDPNTDSWGDTSTTNAPQARYVHTVVWAATEMIVWGGNGGPTYYDNLNSGGRYNPTTDTWTATSTVNAPEARWFHTAVWTGSEMIVWGGNTGFSSFFNTGGRYNPSTDSWSSTSTANAPTGRDSHSAVWTGSDMIVWGGFAGSADTDTGGRYHPGTDSWIASNTTNAPSAREGHTAIWTGDEMIVWGGGGDGFRGLSTGGRYSPATNSWATTNDNAPTARSGHTAVWTGTEMIVWGGEGNTVDNNLVSYTNTGGRFTPSTDAWVGTSNNNAPSPRRNHTAVWTGTEMIVWGGYFYDGNDHFLNTGGKYNPAANNWTATSTSAPSGRDFHTAIWTGSEMIIWGGYNYNFLNTGGAYNPNTNSWVATSLTNAPSARYQHTAVWTGTEMIVWGGGVYDTQFFNTGGRYNPSTTTWAATSTSNAPSERQSHAAVWTGSEMIVWGGNFWDGTQHYLNSGGTYNTGTNSWAATSTATAPSGRNFHTAVWTGSEMIVWGGGEGYSNFFNTGGRYKTSSNSWVTTSTTNAPAGRRVPTAVWTGTEMIVWGGDFGYGVHTDTGGRYCAQGGPSPTPTPTLTPTSTPTPTPTPTPCTGRCEPTPRPRPTPAPRP